MEITLKFFLSYLLSSRTLMAANLFPAYRLPTYSIEGLFSVFLPPQQNQKHLEGCPSSFPNYDHPKIAAISYAPGNCYEVFLNVPY